MMAQMTYSLKVTEAPLSDGVTKFAASCATGKIPKIVDETLGMAESFILPAGRIRLYPRASKKKLQHNILCFLSTV